MDLNIWLTNEQISLLRASLLRMRDALRGEVVGDGALRIALVESALTRLSSGRYGECLACEEPLAFDVLAQRPEAAFCEDCERDRKRGPNHRMGD